MPFDRHNLPATRPVLISVPHAGRQYPDDRRALRLPLNRLTALEDRYADMLVDRAIAQGTPAIVARIPRLWIDLNRSESDMDLAMVGTGMSGRPPLSAKIRGGLGLIPRKIAASGEIWHLPLSHDDVRMRISQYHRPYHAEIAAALTSAKRRFGAALLLDVHSMPPLNDKNAPGIVIGDRFGAGAASWLTEAAVVFFQSQGLRVAINAPYPGGHIVGHHPCPAANVHALQVEVDRTLYLDANRDAPGPGLARMQTILTGLVNTLTEELLADGTAIAAQ